jgi:hypothetical protein
MNRANVTQPGMIGSFAIVRIADKLTHGILKEITREGLYHFQDDKDNITLISSAQVVEIIKEQSSTPPKTYEERLQYVLDTARQQNVKPKVFWKEYSQQLINTIALDFNLTLTKVSSDYKELIWNHFKPF